MMTDSETLKALKAIIKERAFKSLYEYQRVDWSFGYQSALKELWEDLKKLEEKK